MVRVDIACGVRAGLSSLLLCSIDGLITSEIQGRKDLRID